MSTKSSQISNKHKKIIFWLLAALAIILIFLNFFWNVGKEPVARWDEARHIVSAIEVLQTGNFLVNTYLSNPDYWNVKPPLSIWGAALGHYIFQEKSRMSHH